jgi:hypothetical protein
MSLLMAIKTRRSHRLTPTGCDGARHPLIGREFGSEIRHYAASVALDRAIERKFSRIRVDFETQNNPAGSTQHTAVARCQAAGFVV